MVHDNKFGGAVQADDQPDQKAIRQPVQPAPASPRQKPRKRMPVQLDEVFADSTTHHNGIDADGLGEDVTHQPAQRDSPRPCIKTSPNPSGDLVDSSSAPRDSPDEGFLVENRSPHRSLPGRNGNPKCDRPTDPCSDDWYGSEAYELIAQDGSEDLPGNRKIAVQKWLFRYFNNTERAFVFAQLLYWFGKTSDGRRRASRREGNRPVLDKTHQQLADELGLGNKRKIESHLRAFKEQGLLDYRTIGYGEGKTTRIWLMPDGVLAAYREGCRRIEAREEGYDKSGGS